MYGGMLLLDQSSFLVDKNIKSTDWMKSSFTDRHRILTQKNAFRAMFTPFKKNMAELYFVYKVYDVRTQ